MLYTTVSKVREVAGFVGNSNVGDAFILNIIQRVQGVIDGAVASVYQLPLPTFYKNTLTFSGTGGGSTANLTITIDGEAYAVSITSGLTASQVADAFRVLFDADTDKDFVVIDESGQGAIITIATSSQDGVRADVTATGGGTVNSVTATLGGVFGSPAMLLESIATCLASGYLLNSEYGAEAQDTTKEGDPLIESCMDMLDQIRDKTLKIYDFSGSALPYATLDTIDFYPDEASRDDENDTANKFTMNRKF